MRTQKDSRMSEAQSSGTKPKKMVSWNVVVALGVICIVLVIVSLVGAFEYYTLIMNNRDSKISSLNTQIDSLNRQILEQNHTISALNTNLTTLQEQASNIKILGAENLTWFLQVNRTDSVSAMPRVNQGSGGFNASGYVVNWISSNSNSTYVEIDVYVNNTYLTSKTINVGFEGIAIIPIPVASYVTEEVGVSTGSARVTWTAMYTD